METFWFYALCGMLTLYAILDGFDLGAGVVQLLTARNSKERENIQKAIAPYWDGNEVWLLAAGGVLVMAFPKIYASAFSGLYLPLMLVLWLLIGRAIAIEFRHHFHHPLWCDFWERVFSWSSLVLTVVFGAALGNVVRGFNLDGEGYFFAPLWTTFRTAGQVGVLDWFTVLAGLTSLFLLTVHGAHFLSLRLPESQVAACRTIGKRGSVLLIPWIAVISAAALYVQPMIGPAFTQTPAIWLPLGLSVVALLGMNWAHSKEQDGWAFICSSSLIAALTLTTAMIIYPNMLLSSDGVSLHLTIWDAQASEYSRHTALLWWPIGIGLCLLYFGNLYRGFWYRLEEDRS